MFDLGSVVSWVLPVVLVATAWVMFARQAVHTAKVGVAGVSAEAWASMLTSRVVIAIYGWVVADPVQVVAASVPAACSVFIIVAALRAATVAVRWRVGAWGVVAAAVGVVSAVASGVVVASVALVAMAVLSSVPQLVGVVRDRDVSGVSVSAWVVSSVCACAWLLYGALGGYVAVVVSNVVWLSASVGIAAVVVMRSRRVDSGLALAAP